MAGCGMRMAVSVVVGIIGWVACAAGQEGLCLRAENGKQWYKGNLHSHTLWSDGDAAPEVAVAWYLDHGYNFLCLSDHNQLNAGTRKRYRPISDKGPLTPQRVADIKASMGKGWVREQVKDGHRQMRLKSVDALKKRFEKRGAFLLIPGEEISQRKPDVHVGALNIRKAIRPVSGKSATETVRTDVQCVLAQSKQARVPMLTHLNHPNFAGGVPAEALIAVPEVRFFEVYNGHPSVANAGKPARRMVSTDRFWDIALACRLAASPDAILYGLATDDTHDLFKPGPTEANPGRGWTMVLADALTTEALFAALNRGASYASTGVTLDEISADRYRYSVQICETPGVTYTTQFLGTLKNADLSSQAPLDDAGKAITDVTRQYNDAVGQVLLETTANPAVYTFQGTEQYVRARVVSSKLMDNPVEPQETERAWTQPVMRP